MPTKETKAEKRLREEILEDQFLDALDDPHTRIEYIRKKDRSKQGVMISCKHPDDDEFIIFGFSMCRLSHDVFNKLEGRISRKNFGKMIAFKRAMKYSDISDFMVYSIQLDKRVDRVYIPQTVADKMDKFIQASYKYYKDCEFPAWVLNAFPCTMEPSDNSSTSSPSDASAMEVEDPDFEGMGDLSMDDLATEESKEV